MYDALLEHSLSAGIVGKDLSGEDFLLEQTKPIDEKCKRVVKLYFDIGKHDKPTIYFETEVIFDGAYKKYLYFGNAGRQSSNYYLTTQEWSYVSGYQINNDKKKKEETKKKTQKKKIPLLNNENFCIKKISTLFYSNGELIENIAFKDIKGDAWLDLKDFEKLYKNDSLFILGVYAKSKYLLFCDSRKYRKTIQQLSSSEDKPQAKKEEIAGICDFCQENKILKKEFKGGGVEELKRLKTFTSTKKSVCYQLNNKDIGKNLRCCESCFNLIAQIDRKLDGFKIGYLKEEKLNSKEKDKRNFVIYATIQNPTNSAINFKNIHSRLETIFGGNKNAFDSIRQECGENPIFDKKIIFNIYIADFDGKAHSTVLNIRNINPRLFEKYFKAMEFISVFNEYFTHRGWKGSFSDMFKTLSMADYRVGLDVFTAVLNNFSIDGKYIAGLYGHLLRKRFLNAEDKDKPEIKYLPMDIFSILLFEQLRQKEDILEFKKELFLNRKEKKDEQGKVAEVSYEPKSTAELKQSLGTDWSESEMAVIDLGRLISSIVYEVKNKKNTDIEKVFLSRLDFVEMSFDSVRAYCGFLEQKMREYSKAIGYLDLKRNDLGTIQLALEKNKNHSVAPKSVGYFLSFGYNISGLLWGKAAQEGEFETKNLKNQGA